MQQLRKHPKRSAGEPRADVHHERCRVRRQRWACYSWQPPTDLTLDLQHVRSVHDCVPMRMRMLGVGMLCIGMCVSRPSSCDSALGCYDLQMVPQVLIIGYSVLNCMLHAGGCNSVLMDALMDVIQL